MIRYLSTFVKFLLVYSLILLLSCFIPLPILAHSSNEALHTTMSQTFVKITPSYKKPTSLKYRDTLTLQGVGYGEYLELKVIGTIKNVQLTSVIYDETTDSFTDFQSLGSFDTLHNQTLVISTYFPCGMPQEKLSWQSLSGETSCYLLAEDGKEGLKPITYTYEDPFFIPQLPTPPMLPTTFRPTSSISAYYTLYFMMSLVSSGC